MPIPTIQPLDDGRQLGVNLEQLRLERGWSYNRLSRLLYDAIGNHAPTAETLRMYHSGDKNPDRVDLVVVTALAVLYEIDIADLSPIIAKRIDTLLGLLRHASPNRRAYKEEGAA